MMRMLGWTGVAAGLLLVTGCGEQEREQSAGGQTTVVNKPVVDEAGDASNGASNDSAKKAIAIGDAAPAWENLTGTDGKQHSLKDLEEAEAVAVVFTCNRCPVAVAYQDRLITLANDYQDKGVEIVAINVNPGEAEKLPAMKDRAEESGFTFAYLSDPSQEIGRAYGATVTPHVFLLDKDRNVVYMGAIDDNQDVSKVEHHHLRDAIDATLAGKAPATTTTKQFGCGISYE